MIVLVMSAVKPGLRGELSRWMIEAQTGVFVGHLSARIRDRLWEKVVKSCGTGTAVLIHDARNEQGFIVRSHGELVREPIDFEGITLIRQRSTRKH
ncbi:MAG: type I-E CRISPR-associated endoribonuclease Cas2 [Chthonomonadaceae bacterium]|nr:type I-E CRISPR-associated endoribonuclease Cas2 [Chthonomonadaceae bacterium]